MTTTASPVVANPRDVLTQRAPRRSWLTLALFAVLVLQAATVAFVFRPWVTADSQKYLQLAEALAHGRFGIETVAGYLPEAVRPIGYPIFLTLFHEYLRMPVAGIIALQIGLYLASVALCVRLLNKFSYSPVWFLVALLVYPAPAAYCARIMSEAVSLFLVTLAAYVMATDSPEKRSSPIILGLVTAAAAITRPDLVLLPLVAFFSLWWRRSFRASAIAISALVPLIAAVIFLPLAVRNLHAFGKFTPLPPAAALGNSLYTASWENEVSYEDITAFYNGSVTQHALQSGFKREVNELNSSIGAPENTPPFNPECYPTNAQRLISGKVLKQAALARIRLHPGAYLKHVAVSWIRLWNTAGMPASLGFPIRTALAGVSLILTIAGLLGAFSSLRSVVWGPVAVLLLYFPAVHCWLHTEARYTASARLLLVLFAYLAAGALLGRFGAHFREKGVV